ncbi:trypanothione synthetase-like protein [Leishmania tarentolae]|uniref:Trypanothione synthetase-like protein n=1 Tax=Leishmania tarentolae TaxID=5689 RepID=A0A640KWJ3_LEITA|nr:trypanothione synthetase-like protein [Leishmania tarentolae]
MTAQVELEVSVLPYGEHQGSFRGVVACSNRDDGYFSGENNYVDTTIYTGFRYQCVEYARRFLLLTTGCVFANCDRASEIYAMDHITHVETGVQYTLHHHHNDGTATQKPTPGDIIIYPYHPELAPWGHVGVISFVEDNRVGIAEQNHYFGLFTSPSESYLNGERCVARYATLTLDEAAKTWRIEEPGPMPSAVGWMSYPDAPTREQIHAPLMPLPCAVKARSTPFDQDGHPFLIHYYLPNGIEIPSGCVRHAYGMRNGAGETLVGATTAVARVLRFTLLLFFHRSRLGPAFRALPTNPLNATLPKGADACTMACREIDALFEVLAEEEVVNATEGIPDVLRQALATYFSIPLEWVMAMERDFAKGETHMAAVVSFYPNIATDSASLEAFHAARKKAGTDGASAAERILPSTASESIPDAEEPFTARCPDTADEFPFKNPHEEAWCLAQVNFGDARVMTVLPQLNKVKQELTERIARMTPSMSPFISTQYRKDFASYLKGVEAVYGPRTGFVIVVSDDQLMSGFLRELVTTLQNLCTLVEYPVRVVNEKDLTFSNGTLHASPSGPPPEVGSQATNIAPSGAFDVNFVYVLCEWPCILEYRESTHSTLYRAAVDPESDVVFAKPLWAYLCCGTVNDGDQVERAHHTSLSHSRSVRFFDVCRRLYLLASPKQPAKTWDLEVSEYKDSCRRIHIDAEPVSVHSPVHLSADSLMINLAGSCYMGHVDAIRNADSENTGIHAGDTAFLMFMFPTRPAT